MSLLLVKMSAFKQILEHSGIGAFAVQMAQLNSIVLSTAMKFETLRKTIDFVAGDKTAGKKMFDFAEKEASRTNTNLLSTAEGFTKLSIAARGTKLEGELIKEIFSALTQAAGTFGLTAEETSGAILAVTQMIGKGVVSAEELRGQLAERVPGAFQIAARSMQMTEQQLFKLMAAGQLASVDFLPKFARQLYMETSKGIGGPSLTAQASLTALQNSFSRFSANFGKIILPSYSYGLQALGKGLDLITVNLENLFKVAATFSFAYFSGNISIILKSILSYPFALNKAIFAVTKFQQVFAIAASSVAQIMGSAMVKSALRFAKSMVMITVAVESVGVAIQALSIANGKTELRKITDGLAESWNKVTIAINGAKSAIEDMPSSPRSVGGTLGFFDDTLRKSPILGAGALGVTGGAIAGLSSGASLGAATAAGVGTATAGAGILAAGGGYLINRGVNLAKGGQGDFVSWADLKQEKELLTISEASEMSAKIFDKAKEYRDALVSRRGIGAEIISLDEQIKAQKIKVAGEAVGTESRKNEQVKLDTLASQRKTLTQEIVQLQSETESQIKIVEAEVNRLKDSGKTELAQALNTQVLSNLKNTQIMFKNLADTAGEVSPYRRLTQAMALVEDSMARSQREGNSFLTTQKKLIAEMQIAQFSKNPLVSHQAALAQIDAELKMTETQIAEKENAIKMQKEALSDPIILAEYKALNISPDSSVEELNRVKEAAQQEDTKKIIDGAIKAKEIEERLAEQRVQYAEQVLKKKQQAETFALAEIEKSFAASEAMVKQSSLDEIAAVKRKVLDRTATESFASEQIATINAKSAKEQKQLIDIQLLELRKKHKEGIIGAETFADKEKNLILQSSEANIQAIEAEIQAREALRQRALEDLEWAKSSAESRTQLEEARGQLLLRQQQAAIEAAKGTAEGERFYSAESSKLRVKSAQESVAIAQQNLDGVKRAAAEGILKGREAAQQMSAAEKAVVDARMASLDALRQQQAEKKRLYQQDVDNARQSAEALVQIAEMTANIKSKRRFLGLQKSGKSKEAASGLEIDDNKIKLQVAQANLKLATGELDRIEDGRKKNLIEGEEYSFAKQKAQIKVLQAVDAVLQAESQQISNSQKNSLQQLKDGKEIAEQRIAQQEAAAAAEARIRQNQIDSSSGQVAAEREFNRAMILSQQAAAKARLEIAQNYLLGIEKLNKKELLLGDNYKTERMQAQKDVSQAQEQIANIEKQRRDENRRIRQEDADSAKKATDNIDRLSGSGSEKNANTQSIESNKIALLANVESVREASFSQAEKEILTKASSAIGSVPAEQRQATTKAVGANSLRELSIVLKEQSNLYIKLKEQGILTAQEVADKIFATEIRAEQSRLKITSFLQNLSTSKTDKTIYSEDTVAFDLDKAREMRTKAEISARADFDTKIKTGKNEAEAEVELQDALNKAKGKSLEEVLRILRRQFSAEKELYDSGAINKEEYQTKISEINEKLINSQEALLNHAKETNSAAVQNELDTVAKKWEAAKAGLQTVKAKAELVAREQYSKDAATLGPEKAEKALQQKLAKIRGDELNSAQKLLRDQLASEEGLRKRNLISQETYNSRRKELSDQLTATQSEALQHAKETNDQNRAEEARKRQERLEWLKLALDAERQVLQKQLDMQDLYRQEMEARAAARKSASDLTSGRLQASLDIISNRRSDFAEAEFTDLKQSLESRMGAERLKALKEEQALAKELLEIDRQRSEIAARQRRGEAVAAVRTAEAAVADAEAEKDRLKIASARSGLKAAIDALEVAKANETSQSRTSALARQSLESQQAGARLQSESAESARKYADEIERAQVSLRQAERALDRQKKLLESSSNLSKSRSDLAEVMGQAEMARIERGVDLARRLSGGGLSARARREAREQLKELGLSGLSEAGLLQKRAEAEAQAYQRKFKILVQEQQLQKQLLSLDVARSEAAARTALREAEILKLRAQQEKLKGAPLADEMVASAERQVAEASAALKDERLLGQSALASQAAQQRAALEQFASEIDMKRLERQQEIAEASTKRGAESPFQKLTSYLEILKQLQPVIAASENMNARGQDLSRDAQLAPPESAGRKRNQKPAGDFYGAREINIFVKDKEDGLDVEKQVSKALLSVFQRL